MHNKLMRSKFFLEQRLYYKSKYGFGIIKGTVVGLHDDFLKVKTYQERDNVEIVTVKFEEILSVED